MKGNPSHDKTFYKLIMKARKTNAQRDAIERRHGFAAPESTPDDILFNTIRLAFEAGLKRRNWDCIAEGYVMLIDNFLTRLEAALAARRKA